METASARDVPRWELYRLLSDPVRVRMLALCSLEELSVGELAEVLREGQPKVSRHAAALREAGVLSARKQGTWVLLRLAPRADADPVIADAVRAGRASCAHDGTLAAMEEIVLARDASGREFFARPGRPVHSGPPSELAAYLAALSPLLGDRSLAIDAGTGDGALLEVLCPLFDKVIAIDRSEAQLERARGRAARRGFDNLELVVAEVDKPIAKRILRGRPGADVVFASRMLHHAVAPRRTLAHLAALARPDAVDRRGEPRRRGGHVLVLDYLSHEDVALRDAQADVWLGFSQEELVSFAEDAGLVDVRTTPVPAPFCGDGPDRHLPWLLLSGRPSGRETDEEEE